MVSVVIVIIVSVAVEAIFQYFDGLTGDLRYAEAISLTSQSPLVQTTWEKRSGATVETKN